MHQVRWYVAVRCGYGVGLCPGLVYFGPFELAVEPKGGGNSEGILAGFLELCVGCVRCNEELTVLHLHAPEDRVTSWSTSIVLSSPSSGIPSSGALHICSSVNWRNVALSLTEQERVRSRQQGNELFSSRDLNEYHRCRLQQDARTATKRCNATHWLLPLDARSCQLKASETSEQRNLKEARERKRKKQTEHRPPRSTWFGTLQRPCCLHVHSL